MLTEVLDVVLQIATIFAMLGLAAMAIVFCALVIVDILDR